MFIGDVNFLSIDYDAVMQEYVTFCRSHPVVFSNTISDLFS
jgi:hypothetical protein